MLENKALNEEEQRERWDLCGVENGHLLPIKQVDTVNIVALWEEEGKGGVRIGRMRD
jgi:hypothetical protein